MAQFKQIDNGRAPIGISLRRCHQPGQKRRAHMAQLRGNRIGQLEPVGNMESLGLCFGNKRPSDRLDQTACRQSAPHQTGAALRQSQGRLGDAIGARQRR